jgi:hypothetical protein
MQVKRLSLLLPFLFASSASLISSVTSAETPKYQPPTRGFFIEHGTVAGTGQASVELHSGADAIDSGGGVRLGLPNAELLFNSGLDAYDENEALLKYALKDVHLGETNPHAIQWALIAGFSHAELENEQGVEIFDQTNFKVGAAFTIDADAARFTFAPRFVYADGELKDDEFLELDIGGYVGIIDTEVGLFSAGFEALLTTESNNDNRYNLGMRWAYNDRLTIDLVPLILDDADLYSVPGLVRVNARF